MNRRIMVWAAIGVAVACAWAMVAMFAAPHFNVGRSNIVAITAPVALVGRRRPLGVVSSVFLNGCIYALAGLVFELMRKAAPLLRTR